jgi:hypothetical protein
MSETNINYTYVLTVEKDNKNYYYWDHLVDAIDIHDFNPRYYKCKEVLLKDYPNKMFISEVDMLRVCKDKLGELEIMPGIIVSKKTN